MTRARFHVLELVARVALRVSPPRRAKATVDRAARWIGASCAPSDARRGATWLDRSGTCLSRALAVAACLPDSVVVIGVGPDRARGVAAHAWVELDGAPLRESDPDGEAIARLR